MFKNNLYYSGTSGGNSYTGYNEVVPVALAFTMFFPCNTIRILDINYFAYFQGTTRYVKTDCFFTFFDTIPYNITPGSSFILNTTHKKTDLIINTNNTFIPGQSVIQVAATVVSGDSFDSAGLAVVEATLEYEILN